MGFRQFRWFGARFSFETKIIMSDEASSSGMLKKGMLVMLNVTKQVGPSVPSNYVYQVKAEYVKLGSTNVALVAIGCDSRDGKSLVDLHSSIISSCPKYAHFANYDVSIYGM